MLQSSNSETPWKVNGAPGIALTVLQVDGCVTWKVLGNWKWRPSMEHAWKSLLRNLTFFWLVSQGGGSVEGREGDSNWFEGNFTTVNGATTDHKGTTQKAYRFKGTLVVEEPVVCLWAKLGMTGNDWCLNSAWNDQHGSTKGASLNLGCFYLPKLILCKTSHTVSFKVWFINVVCWQSDDHFSNIVLLYSMSLEYDFLAFVLSKKILQSSL